MSRAASASPVNSVKIVLHPCGLHAKSHTNKAGKNQRKLRINAVNGLDHGECFINGVRFAFGGWLSFNRALSVRPWVVRCEAGCNRVLVDA